MQASNNQVETSSDYQSRHDDLNLPEVKELDHYVNSPSSPKFVSILQSAMKTNSYRFHLQTVVEEVDEIKEIDEGILCELDNVGDFSIGQLVSGTSEFEKHIESVGEEITAKTAPHGDANEPVSTNQASLVEVGLCDDAEANDKQTADSKTPIVDCALPHVESKETQGASSELHVAEDVPLESKAPPTHVSDGETRVQLELKSDDESVEVKADDNKIGPCDEKSSSLISSAIEGEKPNHGDKAVKDSDSPSSGKGKGKLSRSSSSSSSSSSDSSSSASDRE